MRLRRYVVLILLASACVTELAVARVDEEDTIRSLEKKTVDVRPGKIILDSSALARDSYRAFLDLVSDDPELRAEAMRRTDIAGRGDVEEELSAGVRRLLAVAENYPDLKANQNFLDLQDELIETEKYLQFARRYYNGSVRDYNTRIQSVPSNIVAGIFGFTPREFFQKASDEAGAVPVISLGGGE